MPQHLPGRRREAQEHLEKVYGSSFRVFDKKDMAEGSGTTGGYTVAPDYGKELLQLAQEESIVRPYSNNKKLPAREAYYPDAEPDLRAFGDARGSAVGLLRRRQDDLERRSPARHADRADLQAGPHRHERAPRRSPRSAGSSSPTSFLSLDSPSSSRCSPSAIAYAEDYAFLAGDGVARPKGVLQSPRRSLTPPRAAANKFQLKDAANVMGAMTPQSRPKSVWVTTNNLFSELVQLVDASGRVTYIPNVGTGYNEAKLAMGQLLLVRPPRPLHREAPPLGTTGDVLLADFSKYITADTGSPRDRGLGSVRLQHQPDHLPDH